MGIISTPSTFSFDLIFSNEFTMQRVSIISALFLLFSVSLGGSESPVSLSCNKIGLKGPLSGRFVSVQPDTSVEVNRRVWFGWEHITVIPAEQPGYVYLRSAFRKYLSAQPNGELQWNRGWKMGWEKFQMVREGEKIAFKAW